MTSSLAQRLGKLPVTDLLQPEAPTSSLAQNLQWACPHTVSEPLTYVGSLTLTCGLRVDYFLPLI